jgi:hypothetical protein
VVAILEEAFLDAGFMADGSSGADFMETDFFEAGFAETDPAGSDFVVKNFLEVNFVLGILK